MHQPDALLIRNGSGNPIGVVRRPWAIDAIGTRVTTSFVVRGRTLVQRVAHRGAAYPVVADPSIDFGLTSATLTLNPQDQRIILSTGGAIAGSAIGALLCSGSGPGAAVCAIVGAGLGTAQFETIKEYGVKENCDVKVRIGYIPPHIDNIWREGSGCGMTYPIDTTIRAPWLHGVRWQETTRARRAPSFSPLLRARWRRALGVAMTSAGAGAIVMSAAEEAANPALAPVGQLLIVVLSTAGVVHCTVAGDGGDSR